MTRFAREFEVLYWEEPMDADAGSAASVERRVCPASGVVVLTPRLPLDLCKEERQAALRALLSKEVAKAASPLIRWYYTPMMLEFSRRLEAVCTVYDCMDELKNFRFAPPELAELEAELMGAADVVFTGGYSLYEAKRAVHANIHPFPSSVDRAHFSRARLEQPAPPGQASRPRPRLGFYGVVDERMDRDLLAAVADARPDWTLEIVGPVAKIDPADLPRRANIHYLGPASYADLPRFLSGWDVALMPFAINESTRFISPTKTPEYLAGGRPVVSTPIKDVERHYGDLEGVFIAHDAEEFVAACEAALRLAARSEDWLEEADKALADLSWDRTFEEMLQRIEAIVAPAGARQQTRLRPYEQAPAMRPSDRARAFDYLVVGAGFAGSVMAERLAAGLGARVLVIDRRPHVGGNAYDHKDAAGILIHRYGPHIFHTNSQQIVDYLSRFTRWRPYEHRVLADVGGVLAPIPINRTTLNLVYGLDLATEAEAAAFLASRAEPVEAIRTSKDVVLAAVGRDLYEKFFEGYTRKQWGLDPSELDKSVTSRVPTRTNTDDRYFQDSFQAMPARGYTAMFENMLDHENIEIELGVDFEEVRDELIYDHVIYTGPIDEYFGHRFGELPYRSLEFRHETLDVEWRQPVGVVNYPSTAVPYTRVTEYKHLTGQVHPKTSITYEHPKAGGDPYYPVPRAENQALYKRYEALALSESGVDFVGRLATYRYYNMDQVVGQALASFRRLAQRIAPEAASAARAALDSLSASS
jgi:UDP-galactopyranose mutase